MNRKAVFYVAIFKQLNKISIVSPVLRSAPPCTRPLPPSPLPPSPLHDYTAEANTIRAKEVQGVKNKTTVYFNTWTQTAAQETEIKHGNECKLLGVIYAGKITISLGETAARKFRWSLLKFDPKVLGW